MYIHIYAFCYTWDVYYTRTTLTNSHSNWLENQIRQIESIHEWDVHMYTNISRVRNFKTQICTQFKRLVKYMLYLSKKYRQFDSDPVPTSMKSFRPLKTDENVEFRIGTLPFERVRNLEKLESKEIEKSSFGCGEATCDRIKSSFAETSSHFGRKASGLTYHSNLCDCSSFPPLPRLPAQLKPSQFSYRAYRRDNAWKLYTGISYIPIQKQ